jgi:hypothetical protein
LNWHISNNNAAPLLPLSLGTWRVVTAVQNGTASTFLSTKDAAVSVQQPAPISAGSAPLSLGNSFASSESMGGFVAEIRVYASALNATDRAYVEGLLKVKYGQ